MHTLKRLAFVAAFALSACGGGGDAPQFPAATPAARIASLVFLGNSLTAHAPRADVGWSGDWGMAASSAPNDYAHLTGTALGLPIAAYNLAPMETGDTFQIPGVPQGAAVIVELGDNAPADNLAPFSAAYPNLLDAVAGHPLVCVSTWWHNDQKDAIIKSACTARGGVFVSIADLVSVRQDDVGRYPNADVDAHPHDWGMAQIAERVIAALKP